MFDSPIASVLIFVSVLFLGGEPVHGQRATDPDSLVRAQALQLQAAERAHLWRVAGWGGLNALGGLALVWGSSRSGSSSQWHFGTMSAGWGVVNVGIAAGGLLASSAPPAEPGAVLAAERQFHDLLLLNLGLNVAYSAVGATMVGASHYGVESGGRWRGFGYSLLLQGMGLLVLDGIAFYGSRTRLSSLLDAVMQLSARIGPDGAVLTLQF